MAYYQIKDIGKVGVVTDLSPTDLPPNAFTDAINARFVGGQVTKFGGNKAISYNGAEDNITAFAIQPMPFDQQYDHPFNILGTADGLYLLEDQHWENISYWEPSISGQKSATATITSHPLMTGIKFTENQVNVKVGTSHDLYVELLPTGVKKIDLTWAVAAESLGTLEADPDNPLHMIFHASATLTGGTTVSASNSDSTLTDFVYINVVPNVDALTLNQGVYNVAKTTDRTKYGLASVIFTPPDTVDKDVQWISSDSSVFSIEPFSNPDGSIDLTKVIIVPIRTGSANLTVQMKNLPSIKTTSRVNILPGVSSITLDKSSLSLTKDDTVGAIVTVSVNPVDAPDKTFYINKTTEAFASTITKNSDYSYTFKPVSVGRDVYQFVANDGGALALLQVNTVAATTTSSVAKMSMKSFVQDDSPEDVQSFSVNLMSLFDAPEDTQSFDANLMTLDAAPPSLASLPPVDSDGTLMFAVNLPAKLRHPIGTPVTLGVSVIGGVPGYNYMWYTDGAVTPSGDDLPNITYDGTSVVTEERQVVVKDAAGHTITSAACMVYIYDPTVAPVVETVTLDKTSIDFTQGDKDTIKATVTTSDGNTDNLVYRWTTAKDGIISHDARNTDTFTVYGVGDGTTTVTLTVFPTKQKIFNIKPDNNWYHTTIANCAVFTTNSFAPLVKEFGDTQFKILPGWGDQTIVDDNGNWSVETYDWTCERVRAFNNRLFALNTTEPDEGGVERHYPQRVRWSNFATENMAPTLWDDFADLRDPQDNNNAEGTLKALVNGYAGYIDLADTQGDLIDMIPLKDYLFVYTEFETYVGTPTMNAYQPMTFKKLYNDSGILAPGCAVEIEGGHFVVTQNDIILHNGSTKQSIANSIVKDKIISEVSAVNPAATRVYLHSDKKEVWICYVAAGMPKDTWFNSKAAVWNYEFQTWTFYELPHTYEIVLSDPPTLDKTATWQDYNDPSDPVNPDKLPGTAPLIGLRWEDLIGTRQPWQKNFLNFRKRITIGCSAMKGLYQLDVGSYNYAAFNATDVNNIVPFERPLKMVAERQGIDFDSLTEEWRQKHINNFHFQVNGSGTLAIEVGGTQYSNEKGHEHNYREYIAGKTRNLSVRLNHPYIYYEIIDEDPLSSVTVSGLVIDFALGGRR